LLILEQLRVRAGIAVVTKADIVDPGWLELVVAEADEWLAGSPVAFGPAIPVSCVTGQGIDALRALLAALEQQAMLEVAGQDLFRLPVDRAFTVAGTGTVVTGTSISGEVGVGDVVTLLP